MRVREEYVDYIDWNEDVYVNMHGQPAWSTNWGMEVMDQVVLQIVPANMSYVGPSQNDGEWLIL